jgi:lactoylglutathione lyase
MADRARLIGINHVALEVGDLEPALELYGRLFSFELRGRAGRMAFVDMGDQFLALSEGRRQGRDDARHFGLVVDDVAAVRAAVEREGLPILGSRGLDFLDPWGNRFQVVAYQDIQFERAPGVKRKLGIEHLEKSAAARREIEDPAPGLTGAWAPAACRHEPPGLVTVALVVDEQPAAVGRPHDPVEVARGRQQPPRCRGVVHVDEEQLVGLGEPAGHPRQPVEARRPRQHRDQRTASGARARSLPRPWRPRSSPRAHTPTGPGSACEAILRRASTQDGL